MKRVINTTQPTWRDVLSQEKQQPYFEQLWQRVKDVRAAGHTIYPPHHLVFAALQHTELHAVKVVILGQDPYHGAGQAHGLAFSVPQGIAIPPSLRNIYKELSQDIDGFAIPPHGCLQNWSAQGVLLLNTVLTVPAGQAHAHANWGWEQFTDAVIAQINSHRSGVVFMLWGSHARKKGAMIDRKRHLVLEAPHPSPLSASRGFFGCKHFSQANQYLQDNAQTAIDWQV